MKECRNLREWLESQGNPPHFTAEGDGSMVLAVVEERPFNPGITVYNYMEEKDPLGNTHFWMGSGWGIRKEWLPAIRGLLNSEALLGTGGAE